MTKQDKIKAEDAAKLLMLQFKSLRKLALSDPDKKKGQRVAQDITKMESVIKKSAEKGDSKPILQLINQLSK